MVGGSARNHRLFMPPRHVFRPFSKQSIRLYASRTKSRPTPPSFSNEPKKPFLLVKNATAQTLLFAGFLGWGVVFGLSVHSYWNNNEESLSFWTSSSAPPKADLPKAISLLHSLFPQEGRVITDRKTLQAYNSTNYTAYIGSDEAKPHGVIVFPQSTEDVVKIVKIATQCGLSIVSKGSATSLEGHVISVRDSFSSRLPFLTFEA